MGILLVSVLFSCKKDPYEIGFALLPPSDTLNVLTTDTCTVEAFSVLQDSVRTDKISSLLLGSMMDPVFGRITTSFYTQVRLSSEGAEFGENPVLDSLVLMLSYGSYYGDTLTRQNVKVYEISENFFYDSLHFSNQRLETYPTILADQDFIPRISDSVKEFNEKIAPHLRINLSRQTNYLGQKILYAPDDVLASTNAFTKFIKGLYVSATPVNSNGAILNFSLTDGISKMVVYFHNGNDPQDDSLRYEFPVDKGCARFISVDHNGYLDADHDLKQQILNHDSAQGAAKLFLEGLGGVKVKLKFPYLAGFSKGNIIAVNDAVLLLKNMETDTILAPPPTLTLVRQDSAGRIGYLVDNNEGPAYFGGTYDYENHAYFFRLTQHVQNILQNSYTDHFDLYIMVDNPITSSATPNRIILYGTDPLNPGDYSNRLQLKMTYTILNKN